MSILLGDPGEKAWTSDDTPPPVGGRYRASKYKSGYKYRYVFRTSILILGVLNASLARCFNFNWFRSAS